MDQFYTRQDTADKLVSQVINRHMHDDVIFIEPSAGKGAFINMLSQSDAEYQAFDIEPKTEDIIKLDFLNHVIQSEKSLVFIGNPPFGKNAHMAVRFFNHCAKQAREIAFILPRTFRKISIHDRLDQNFHLIHDSDVEKNAFIYNDKPYNVPCVWQIWTRRSKKRSLSKLPDVSHLLKYTTHQKADCAVRRVGFYAGKVIMKDIDTLSKSTHYFISANDEIINLLKNKDWSSTVNQTVGSKSLSKKEIAIELDKMTGGPRG